MTLVVVTKSWKRVLNSKCIDQMRMVDPWQDLWLEGNKGWFMARWWCSSLQVRFSWCHFHGTVVCWSLFLHVIILFGSVLDMLSVLIYFIFYAREWVGYWMNLMEIFLYQWNRFYCYIKHLVNMEDSGRWLQIIIV